MSLAYHVVVIAVVFCLLLGVGVPASVAWSRAVKQDWGNILSKLPLSDHAKLSHSGELITAELIQLWLSHEVCYPRRFYVGCRPNGTRIMFACKANPAQYGGLWGVMFIGIPVGSGPEQGTVVSGRAIAESRLDATAKASGCWLPAVSMP